MPQQFLTPRDDTTHLFIHHTVGEDNRPNSNQSFYDFLVDEGRRRLESYSYVMLVDPKAKSIEIKRMPWEDNLISNHAYAVSRFSMALSVEGNYEEDEVFDAIEDGCVEWCFKRMSERLPNGKLKYPNLKVANILGHRDAIKWSPKNATACPGSKLYSRLPRIRQRVGDRLKKEGCYR